MSWKPETATLMKSSRRLKICLEEVFKTSWRLTCVCLNISLSNTLFPVNLSIGVIHLVHTQFFVNKMTPSPLWYSHVHFVIPPFPCVRTNLLYPPPPPPPPLLFYVKSNISFKHFSDLRMQLTIFQKIRTFQFFLCTSHIYNKTMFSKWAWIWIFQNIDHFYGTFTRNYASNIFKKQVQNTHFNKTI